MRIQDTLSKQIKYRYHEKGKNTNLRISIDRFDRNVEDKVIVEAYESMENDSFNLPVLKMTPSELAEKINDEIFNDQEYWLRAIEPMQPAYCQREEQLRREIISEIITTLRNEGMNTITFSNISEDRTEMIWFDRHGFTSCSRIETVKYAEPNSSSSPKRGSAFTREAITELMIQELLTVCSEMYLKR